MSSDWVEKLADSDELVNQESSGVSTPSERSKKTELTVLNISSPVAAARKERVLGCVHDAHCHGCLASLFLKRDGNFIFLPI